MYVYCFNFISDNYTAYSKEEPKPATANNKPQPAKRTASLDEEKKQIEEEDSLVLTAEADGELNNSKMEEEEDEEGENGKNGGEGGDDIEILPHDNEYELYAKFWQVQDYFR